MKIERASFGDAEEILRLQKLAYRREAERYNDFGIDPLVQTIEQLQKQFENHVVLKVVLHESIVGSVRAYDQDGTCFIGKLMVHPDHQNKGIGKMLMSAIEGSFPHSRYELFTGSKSESNIAFYEKLGYKTFKEKAISGITFVYFEK
ncbi:GNAT family N-acetyltransferase [Gorillibacterium massiliense]|uniref:GNAT family N-acetyltransferase n=1 Tax=Gorillibacterium massiliense TaxID=1280390 RepID=UPI0004B4872E|nr:GNAT family N-acetyltransferase [Gorillibacterium massiliense]